MRVSPTLALFLLISGAIPAAEPRIVVNSGPPSDLPLRVFGDARYCFTGYFSNSTLSPDGKWLAVLSHSRQRRMAIVTIFDSTTGQPLLVSRTPYEGHGVLGLPGFTYSPDGQKLAVRLNSETAFVLDVATGKILWRQKGKSEEFFAFCAFDANGRLLLTNESATEVIDISTGNRVALLPIGGIAKVTPDGKTYVRTKKVYTEVEVGDLATGKPRYVLPLRTAQNGHENGYAISQDGKSLAVVHSLSEIHLIDLATGATRRSWKLPEDTFSSRDQRYAIAFSHDDRNLTLSAKEVIHTWGLEPFRERLSRSHRTVYLSWQNPHDGNTLWLPRNGVIERWDLKMNYPIQDEHAGPVNTFALTHDGVHLLFGLRDGAIHLWNAQTNQFAREIAPPRQTEAPVRSLLISPDGRNVAAYRHEEAIEVFPLEEKPARRLTTANSTSTNPWQLFLAWSADSRFVYGRQREVTPNEIQFGKYDIAKRLVVKHLDVHSVIGITPDGRELLTSNLIERFGNGRVPHPRLIGRFDIATNRAVGVFHRWNRNSIYPQFGVFSPDGSQFVGAGEQKIEIYGRGLPPFDALDSPPPVAHPEHSYTSLDLQSLAFTPKGHWLISGGDDCAVKVWETATGKLVRRFDGHDLPVKTVAVSPDGRSVFSVSDDGRVYQWSLEPKPASATGPDELFQMAHSQDATLGVSAAWKLISDAKYREFVLRKLPPTTKPDAAKVKGLLDELDAPAFAVRRAAKRNLETLSRSIEAELRERLRTTGSVEVRERLEELIARFEKKLSPEELAAIRLVQACEWYRHTELLTQWATGAPSAVLTREATATLKRLK